MGDLVLENKPFDLNGLNATVDVHFAKVDVNFQTVTVT